jgi:hypothetical protein
VAASARRPRASYGLVLGPIVWSTAYLVLPATGIYKPMRDYDAKTLWRDASAHLAYGVGAATIFKTLAGRRDPMHTAQRTGHETVYRGTRAVRARPRTGGEPPG